MAELTRAGLGLVLTVMAKSANEQAEYCSRRRDSLNNPSELLYKLSFILQAGAQECIRQVEEEENGG